MAVAQVLPCRYRPGAGGTPCRSMSHCSTSRITATTARSTSARRWYACAGAAQPHAHPLLCAAGLAWRALRQLAAGPQGNYLARLVFPEKTEELKVTVDLVAEMAVFNPSTSSSSRMPRRFPSPVCRGRAARAGALSGHRGRRAAVRQVPGRCRARPRPASTSWWRSTSAWRGHPLPDPHGAGRAVAGRNPDSWLRLVPRLRPGCWCSCCAIWGWPRVSSPAT